MSGARATAAGFSDRPAGRPPGRTGRAVLAVVALALAGLGRPGFAADARATAIGGPGAPSAVCPHLDTWNARGVKGPNGVDHVIVSYPAGQASQRGGTCTILVDALYEGARERSYSFLPDGQFLVNERFGRSPERDSAVSGTRAFFLFPMPRRLVLETRLRGGYLVVRLDPARVVEVDRRGMIHSITGAVVEQAAAVTATSEGGLVFRQFDGIRLDTGWARGEVAFRKFPEGESTFTDREGRVCTVGNGEIFSYADRYNPELAFETDAALGRFLAGRCGTGFDVAVLLKGPVRADRAELEPPPRPPAPPARSTAPRVLPPRPPVRGAAP